MWGLALIVAAVGLLVVGTLLVGLGMRGRRVDDHRLCRRCGYDLFGTPDAQRCGECGAELSLPHATRIGHRERRRGLLAGGAAFLVPGVIILGLVGADAFTEFNWQRLRLTSWLIADLDSVDLGTVNTAFTELSRRQDAGSLSPEATRRIHEWVLARQADIAGPWEGAWGDFLESSHRDGQLPPEQWEQYVLNAAVPMLEVRPHIRRGEPLPIGLRFAHRGGSASDFRGMWVWKRVTVGGVEAPIIDEPGEFQLNRTSSSWMRLAPKIDGDFTQDLPTGDAVVEATVDLFVEPGTRGWIDGRFTGTEMGPRSLRLTERTQVRPADAPEALTYEDESIREAMEASVSISHVFPVPGPEGQDHWGCRIFVRGNPALVDWEFWVRYGEREVAGDVDYARFDVATAVLLPVRLLGAEAAALLREAAAAGEPVDVLLRPNLKQLRQRTDAPPAWGGEIIIPGVPVHLEHDPRAAPVFGPEGERPDPR